MLFVANDILSQTITYPVMTAIPGCVGSLWSVFYFREISTRRNYCILAFASIFILSGATMVFLSKVQF